jgi:hypothetical protein
MLVRIIRQPVGFADAVSLRHYQEGQTYEMDSTVADYLVLQGFALFEMRRHQRSSRWRPHERRQSLTDDTHAQR